MRTTKLRVKEALDLAAEIEDLTTSFTTDIDMWRDDPDNNVDGWKDTDEVRAVEHDDGIVELLLYWRKARSEAGYSS